MRRRRDAGYALVAAVAALAAFAYIAYAMLAAERGALAGVGADRVQAALSAAADAGLVIAAERLTGDPRERWQIDSRPYRVGLGTVAITVRIEDERGKIRLNQLDDGQIRLLFESAGATGKRGDELADAFMDWLDDDDEARARGAEAPAYAARGIVPRNGALRSVEELALIRGMDARTYGRIAAAATVFFGNSGGFSPDTAQPLAIAVMTGVGMGAPQVIARERELAGALPALAIGDPPNIAARPLTVRVVAEDGQGGRLERATIIEFPAGPSRGWVIRYRP